MQALSDIRAETADPDPAEISIALRDLAWCDVGAAEGFDPEAVCRRAAGAAITGADLPQVRAVELSIVLADDDFLRQLNSEYRGIDRATNVLAFPANDGSVDDAADEDPALLLGDVVVARQTSAQEAAAQGKRLADHLAHLIVHGTLHLLGFDHEQESRAVQMESLEVAILAGLGITDPYAYRETTGLESEQ